MKTLKKVLSVALVLAMALSLVTIASAADVSKYQNFTDAADIVNKEAVDTLAALGIIAGMPDGSFDPKGNVTRAQAAKIIAYMLLGATSADSLKVTVAPFKDVPATHWAAAYIQYCVTRGIINGLGDGTFNPDGQVTAAQFAKMLLTAIGYGKLGEYVGDNWALNAIVDAQNLGILDTNVDYMAPATRDQIARYAFNCFVGEKCKFVVLSDDISGYKYAEGNLAGNLAQQQKVAAIDAGVVNGVPSRRWTKDNVVLNGNAFPNPNVKVLGTNNSGTTLYNLTTLGKVGYIATRDADVKYYYNGKLLDESTTPKLSEVRNVLGDSDTAFAGKVGWIIDLIDTNYNGKVDIVAVTAKSVATLSNDAYVSSTGLVYVPGVVSAKDKSLVVGYEGLKKDDVVLFYEDKSTGIFHIEKARMVTGQLTSGSAYSLTFAGNFYSQSALNNVDSNLFASIVSDGANFNVDATVWLDNSGAIVKFKTGTPATLPYGVVIGYAYYGFAQEAQVRIVKEDGTIGTYYVAPGASGVVEEDPDFKKLESEAPYGILVKYAFTDDGKIVLTKAAEKAQLTNKYEAKGTTLTSTEGKLHISSSTKVFYFDVTKPYKASGDDKNTVAVTTGFSNTADALAETNVYYFLVPNSSNVLAAVLIGTDGSEVGKTSKYLFATAYSTPNTSYDKGVPVYTYNVYVNGVFTQLKSYRNDLFINPDNGLTTAGIYKYDVNEKGYILDATLDDDYIESVNNGYGYDTKIIDDGFIVVGELDSSDKDIAINVDENTKYYQYDMTNFFAPVAEGSLAVSTNYVHYKVFCYLVDKDGVATEVYYTYNLD